MHQHHDLPSYTHACPTDHGSERHGQVDAGIPTTKAKVRRPRSHTGDDNDDFPGGGGGGGGNDDDDRHFDNYKDLTFDRFIRGGVQS